MGTASSIGHVAWCPSCTSAAVHPVHNRELGPSKVNAPVPHLGSAKEQQIVMQTHRHTPMLFTLAAGSSDRSYTWAFWCNKQLLIDMVDSKSGTS